MIQFYVISAHTHTHNPFYLMLMFLSRDTDFKLYILDLKSSIVPVNITGLFTYASTFLSKILSKCMCAQRKVSNAMKNPHVKCNVYYIYLCVHNIFKSEQILHPDPKQKC